MILLNHEHSLSVYSMPIIYRDYYGKRTRPDGKPGHMEIMPTKQKFKEGDGTDVRLNRARLFNGNGKLVKSVLLDQLGVPFIDNLPGTEDDFVYLECLPRRERI